MATNPSRKPRYLGEGTTWFYMEDAEEEYKKKGLATFGYSYVMNQSEDACMKIFHEDYAKNPILKATYDEAARSYPGDVYKSMKRAYTIEGPMYRNFNQETRGLVSFFDWEEFRFKSVWLLLHRALSRQEKDVGNIHIYRGCSIPFKAKVGSVVKFKQFTSFAANESVPLDFITDPRHSTMFDAEIECGLSVADCSEFPDEEEILIPPHNGFKVTDIKEDRNGLTRIFLKQRGSQLF